MSRGRPASRAASIEAPTSLVWMWQFHRPSPPTTTMESPMPGPHLLEGPHGVVGRLEEVHDLVAQVVRRPPGSSASEPAPAGRRRTAGRVRRGGDRRGRRQGPAVDDGQQRRRAAGGSPTRRRRRPRPGPGPGAARGCGPAPRRRPRRDASSTSSERGRRRARHCSAPSAAARATVRIVPSTGRSTAWRAASLAAARPRARPGPSAPPSPSASTPVRPRSSWERITPEFPRAPMSDPWAMALHTAAICAAPPGAGMPSRREGIAAARGARAPRGRPARPRPTPG